MKTHDDRVFPCISCHLFTLRVHFEKCQGRIFLEPTDLWRMVWVRQGHGIFFPMASWNPKSVFLWQAALEISDTENEAPEKMPSTKGN